MSNIKKIDGEFVNLDLVRKIDITDNFELGFAFGLTEEKNRGIIIVDGFACKIKYKTKEEAEERIIQILKEQNSNKIEI